MRRRPLDSDEKYRLYLNDSEYETAVECAPDRRTRIVMRLAGECSLRNELTVSVRRCDFYIPDVDGVGIVVLDVQGAKDTTEDNTGGERLVWVPRDLYEEILAYCEQENIHDEEVIFDYTTQWVRDQVEKAGENAATKTGNSDFDYLTPHDLRAYFATSMIRRKGIDKEIVKSMGGWDSDKALKPYLDIALEKDIQDELARAGLVEVDVPTPPRNDELANLYEEVREIRDLLKIANVLEERDITVEQLERAEENLDALDEGNPEPEDMPLDRFNVTTGPLSVGSMIAAGITTTIATPVRDHVEDVKNEMRDRPDLVDPAEVDTAMVTVMSLLSVGMMLFGISTSTLPMPTAAGLYAAAIPMATGKAYWDIFYGDE